MKKARKPESTKPAGPPGEPVAAPAGMKVEMWPIDRPIPYAKNARVLSARAIDVVADSLREFGWRQPIVVDAKDVVVAGHTRLRAARERLKLTEVPVHVASDLTPAQIKAYRLADNRTNEESGWDWGLLGPELGELKELGFDLTLTAFNKDEAQKAFLSDWPEEEKAPTGAAQLSGLEYRVVLDCKDEAQQTELLDRFAAEGLKCRALIS